MAEAQALKLMGDVKVKIDELGLLLSDATTALQDEKTASKEEGVEIGRAEGKAEVGQAQPSVPMFSSEEVEAAKVAAKAEGVAEGQAALASLQAKYDALLAAVNVEIEDSKKDTSRLEAAIAPVIAPVEQPVEAPVGEPAPEAQP